MRSLEVINHDEERGKNHMSCGASISAALAILSEHFYPLPA